MVDRLGQNVGRAVQVLRVSGELGNMVILFLADNGAEALDAETTGGELFGSYAWRQDDWKLTDIDDGVWRLFDLASDPGETRDLSLTEPARRAAFAGAWDRYARDVGIVAPVAIPYRP